MHIMTTGNHCACYAPGASTGWLGANTAATANIYQKKSCRLTIWLKQIEAGCHSETASLGRGSRTQPLQPAAIAQNANGCYQPGPRPPAHRRWSVNLRPA